MKYLVLAFCLLAMGCGKGAHVTSEEMTLLKTVVTKYECRVSRSIWLVDRTIAICDTEKECRDICSNYERGE